MPELTNAELIANLDKSNDLYRKHRAVGHGLENSKFRIDVVTLETNARRIKDKIQQPATSKERILATYEEIIRLARAEAERQEILVADLTALQEAVATLGPDVQAVSDKITALDGTVASLTEQVAALTVGAVTQEQIDALTATVGEADAGLDALTTAAIPVIAPEA